MIAYAVLAIRVAGGFGLSAIFAFTAVISTQVVYRMTSYQMTPETVIALRFTLIGALCGLGTATAWMSTDLAPRLVSFRSLAWVAIGLAASWGVYWFMLETDASASLYSLSRQEVANAAIFWAMILPNATASAIGVYLQLRRGIL